MSEPNTSLKAIVQMLDARAVNEIEAGVCAAAEFIDEYRNEPANRKLTSADVQLLREKLQAIYSQDSASDVRPSVVWALGKLSDQSLKPFLVSVLKLAVATKDNDLVWQGIVALDNLGVDILPTGSGSLADSSDNFSLAVSYIARG